MKNLSICGKTVFALLFGIFILLAHAAPASAHQPVYVGGQTSITVPDPEVSKAYYSELHGQPAIYTIKSEKEFSLYLNILSPDIPGASKDFSVSVVDGNGKAITTLSEPATSWQKWYEDFAGDWYWKGPEFKATEPAGTYTVTVSSLSNRGKYVLAPGEAEVFTVAGTPNTIGEIYTVKTLFFGKKGLSVFEGIIGKFLLGLVLLASALILAIAYLLYKRHGKRVR